VYTSSLDPTHRQQQQQQQHVKSPATATSPPGGLPGPSDSAASSVTIAAGVPWLGLAGLSGLMQPGRVQDEVRVRMTQVALQMAELATQLVSEACCCYISAQTWLSLLGTGACHRLSLHCRRHLCTRFLLCIPAVIFNTLLKVCKAGWLHMLCPVAVAWATHKPQHSYIPAALLCTCRRCSPRLQHPPQPVQAHLGGSHP
jgi:hypothetical protein